MKMIFTGSTQCGGLLRNGEIFEVEVIKDKTSNHAMNVHVQGDGTLNSMGKFSTTMRYRGLQSFFRDWNLPKKGRMKKDVPKVREQ